jgi:hypothetical protein
MNRSAAGNGLDLLPEPSWQREDWRGPESMMSLPARQQRALDRIEKTLLADDARFGSLFAIFTRLTWHEAMPGIELVKSGRWHSLRPFAAIVIALIAVASVLMFTLLSPRRRSA